MVQGLRLTMDLDKKKMLPLRVTGEEIQGARPVHPIITMIKWIRASRLSIKNSLSVGMQQWASMLMMRERGKGSG